MEQVPLHPLDLCVLLLGLLRVLLTDQRQVLQETGLLTMTVDTRVNLPDSVLRVQVSPESVVFESPGRRPTLVGP